MKKKITAFLVSLLAMSSLSASASTPDPAKLKTLSFRCVANDDKTISLRIVVSGKLDFDPSKFVSDQTQLQFLIDELEISELGTKLQSVQKVTGVASYRELRGYNLYTAVFPKGNGDPGLRSLTLFQPTDAINGVPQNVFPDAVNAIILNFENTQYGASAAACRFKE